MLIPLHNFSPIRVSFALVIAFLVGGCSHRDDDVTMMQFEVLNERDFKMCFNKELRSNYEIIFVTKSGKTIKQGGPLVHPDASEVGNCYKSQKMQYSFRAYNKIVTKFYEDSLVNENLREIRWKLYKSDFDDPFAEGTFALDSL